MKYLNKLLYLNINPDGYSYRLIYTLFLIGYKLRLLKPNRKIHYIEYKEFILVLTPLAGASSIRSVVNSVKQHDMSEPFKNCSEKSIYLLYRPDNLRLQSFYNKKVRNPTNIAKVRLLASCYPLSPETNVKEFKEWIQNVKGIAYKDKHLFSTGMIVEVFQTKGASVQFLSISDDKEKLESMLGVSLSKVVNSSTSVANYKKAVRFPE